VIRAILICIGLSALMAQTYVLGPGDLLDIKVINLEQINGEYRIDNAGKIVLPYLNELDVGDRTLPQVQEMLVAKLEENFLNQPQVILKIMEYRSRPVAVIGAVHRPGQITNSYDVDLLQVLSEAGGVMDTAVGKVLIIRKSPNGARATLEIDLHKLLYEGEHYLNVPIFPGDTVNVPADVPFPVYVTGEVARAGELTFSRRNRVTILHVISKAGGFTEYAKRKKVMVKRDSDEGTEEFRVNVKAIQAGKADDFEIRPNDIVIVP